MLIYAHMSIVALGVQDPVKYPIITGNCELLTTDTGNHRGSSAGALLPLSH